MAYSSPSPGNTNRQVVLYLNVIASGQGVVTGTAPVTSIAMGTTLTVPALQDVTINASNDVFTWSQLDSSSKQQVATTSTNSISMNVVVDPVTFFGTTIDSTDSTAAVAVQGLLGLSRNKTKVAFALRFLDGVPDGATSTTNDRWIKGQGYITGIAPTVSADSPVWVTPVTITVAGEYLVAVTTAT
jgi:hypothetical protein